MEPGHPALGGDRVLSPLIIVGQGLAGTLAALEAERRGWDFLVVDQGAGNTASRAAAGLFNPLTGPRFSADTLGWDRLIPFYRNLEQTLGTALVHPMPLYRPWDGARVGPDAFPRSAPGWAARALPGGVLIEGGGWVDIPTLLDTARSRWVAAGRLEDRPFDGTEGRGQRVWWCGGIADLAGPVWGQVPGVAGRWQPVRGDVLTVSIPDWGLETIEVGPRFLLPLGQGQFRWGATHESDVDDQGYRPGPKSLLEGELGARLGGRSFEVIGHRWGVRPASRTGHPLVLPHPDEPGWTLFNGFGGRGVGLVPRWLDRLVP